MYGVGDIARTLEQLLAAGTAVVRSEAALCRTELRAIRSDSGDATPVRTAAGWSAAAVLWGNAVVLAGRRFGRDQEVSLVGVPLFGLVAAWWLRRRRGFRLSTLGLRRPRPEGIPRVVTVTTVVASSFAAGCALAGLASFGDEDRGLRTIRTVVGTAFGEELIHRGVLLALWASTGASARRVLVANIVTFGAWHLVSASCGDLAPADVVGPAVLAGPLVWLRLRFRSVFVPVVFHAASNITGVFQPFKAHCPFPLG